MIRRRTVLAAAGVCVVVAAGVTIGVMRRGTTAPAAGSAVVTFPNPDTTLMQPRVAQAISDARRTLRRNAGSAAAWGKLGAVCDAHLLYAEAETCYRRAQQLAPGEFRWPYLLAIVLDTQGAPANEVNRQFEAARTIVPNFPPLFVRLGDALVRQGRLADARNAYARAVELDTDFAMAHRSLGQVTLAMGDPQAALGHLQRAAQYAPNDSLVYAGMAQAYTRLGDTSAAAAATAQTRRLPRDLGLPDPIRFEVESLGVSSELCDKRAARRMAAGDFNGALEDLGIVEETRPRDAGVQYRIGLALENLGRRDEAIARYRRATRIDPTHNAAARRLAELAAP